MTSRNPRWRSTGRILLTAALLAGLAFSGCTKKKKPPPPPPPPPPPKVVIPDPIDVQALLQELKTDARVQFPQAMAPADRVMAESIIRLANAIAKGDATGMRPMLDRPAQLVLDELTTGGDWGSETRKIEQVRIVSLTGTQEERPAATTVGMAIQDPRGAYLLAWNGARAGEGWTFRNQPCQAEVKRRASDFDGVTIVTGFEISIEDALKDLPEEQRKALEEALKDAPPEQRDEIIKRTPSGPVKIPTGPGGS